MSPRTCTSNTDITSRSSGWTGPCLPAPAVFQHMNCGESRRSSRIGKANFKRLGMNTSVAEVVPLAIEVVVTDDELTVQLADGRRISVPLVWFPRLLNASHEQRSDFRLIGAGEGVHWPSLDEDLSVSGLLRGTHGQWTAATAINSTSKAESRSIDPPSASRMSEYRRRRSADTWHWCANCSSYPTEHYVVSQGRPNHGELCNECQVKQRTGACP